MNFIYKSIFCSTFLMLYVFVGYGQDFSSLVQMSWTNNEQLNAQYFQLKQAEAALAEAKSLFGPTVGFGAQYTLAQGGREIDFPIGDLLNPVYGTLNQLTGSNSFPSVENAKIAFLPNNFLDAKLRVQQPIYYPDLAINKQLQSKTIDLKSLKIKAFKRLLSKEVMMAYFQWKMSTQAIEIYKEAEVLLTEAYRVTNSLFTNGKALPSALNRVQAEQAQIKAKLIDAHNQEENAWQFLIFLLNDSNIDRAQINVDLPELPVSLITNGQREELRQMDVGMEMQNLAIKKEDQFYLPKLAAQIDLGSQDFDFKWNPYVLLGINLQWNIYDSKRHIHKKNQAMATLNAQKQEKIFVQKQLDLQERVAKNNLASAILQTQTFQPRIKSAKKTYQEVLKKYKSGVANYLELIDAQTQLTQTNSAYVLARYDAWMKWAELQYITATYPVE